MKNIKLFVFAALFILVACCKDENKTSEKIFPDLNKRSVTSIIIDKLGNKWIGTDTGLFKSVENGYVLQNLSSSSNILSLSYEKNSGFLWVGSTIGLEKVNISSSVISSSAIAS
jgi:ligand-binding sensor domain-containing protein